jgi:HK97 family phage portal protein
MGIFAGVLAEQNNALQERRSSLESPSTPLSYPAEWLLDMWNGGSTDSGVRVSEMTAFQVSTFLACVDLISGCIASLPMHVYEQTRNQNGRASHTIAEDHDAYDLINLEPNEEMSSAVFTKAFVVHMLAWSNGYAEIQRDSGNSPIALWPRNPYKTKPHRVTQTVTLAPVAWRPFPVILPAGTLCYKTTDYVDDQDRSEIGATGGIERLIPKEDMLHVPGLSFDGRVGQGVVYMARNMLGLALATEKFGSKYFANFAKPGGILELPVMQKPEDRERTRQSWMEAQGGENSHRVAVVPPGTKFTPISNNPEQSQTVELRQLIRSDIAALFHVPGHMVGVDSKGKSSSEQEAQEFQQYCLASLINPIKQEFKRKLFPHSGIGRTPRNRFYVGFDMSDFIRPDAASREKYIATMKMWGNFSTNDCLAKEGENPINEPWADQYWMPINMTLTTTPVDPTHQDGAGNGIVPDDGSEPPDETDKTPEKDKVAA